MGGFLKLRFTDATEDPVPQIKSFVYPHKVYLRFTSPIAPCHTLSKRHKHSDIQDHVVSLRLSAPTKESAVETSQSLQSEGIPLR